MAVLKISTACSYLATAIYSCPSVVRVAYVVGIFAFQKLVFTYGFFQLAVFEIDGGEALARKLEVIFEFEAVLIKFDGLRFISEPFVTMTEGIKSHGVARLTHIDGIEFCDGLLEAIFMEVYRGGGHSAIYARGIIEKIKSELFGGLINFGGIILCLVDDFIKLLIACGSFTA